MTLGKIFYSSWGYEQTNIDFYKVIGVSKSGKSITLQQIGGKVVEHAGFCSEYVVPNEEKEIGEPIRNRRLNVSKYSGQSFVNVSRREDWTNYAYEWGGQPLLQTDYY